MPKVGDVWNSFVFDLRVDGVLLQEVSFEIPLMARAESARG